MCGHRSVWVWMPLLSISFPRTTQMAMRGMFKHAKALAEQRAPHWEAEAHVVHPPNSTGEAASNVALGQQLWREHFIRQGT